MRKIVIDSNILGELWGIYKAKTQNPELWVNPYTIKLIRKNPMTEKDNQSNNRIYCKRLFHLMENGKVQAFLTKQLLRELKNGRPGKSHPEERKLHDKFKDELFTHLKSKDTPTSVAIRKLRKKYIYPLPGEHQPFFAHALTPPPVGEHNGYRDSWIASQIVTLASEDTAIITLNYKDFNFLHKDLAIEVNGGKKFRVHKLASFMETEFAEDPVVEPVAKSNREATELEPAEEVNNNQAILQTKTDIEEGNK